MIEVYEELESDVVIIGGGLAGLNAAIAAGERDGSVIVVEKGNVKRSGCIAGGVDHFMAYLNQNDEWDTEESFLSYVKKLSYGVVNLKIHRKVFCDELKEAITRMEKIGNPLYGKDGRFFRTQSYGAPGPYWINFNGKNLKPKLARYARKVGCETFNRTIPVKILKNHNRVAGIIAFNYRDEMFYFIKSRAVLIATGNTNRLFETPTGMPFNTWLCPYNTGDGQALAFNAGAKLANMEFVRMTVVPKGFSAPGLNAFVGLGARFINSNREYFMERYHELGDRAPRNVLVYACLNEIREGRGPIYLDCTEIPEDRLKHLVKTLALDKDTLPDFFESKKIDISKEFIEISVSEGMQAGPSEVVGSGIKIDENCMSSIDGLFAAGDCSDQMRCVHMAVTGGYAAGKNALEYARNAKSSGSVKKEEIRHAIDEFLKPLSISNGISYIEFEDVLRKIMAEHVGPFRTESGLRAGIRKLESLKEDADQLMASDGHELLRVYESKNLLTVGMIMAHAALFRRESRFIPYHYRLDFPNSDNERWCGQVVVYKDGETIRCEFEKITY